MIKVQVFLRDGSALAETRNHRDGVIGSTRGSALSAARIGRGPPDRGDGPQHYQLHGLGGRRGQP